MIKKIKQFECGCRVYRGYGGVDEVGLIYCPMHAAAPAMFEASTKQRKATEKAFTQYEEQGFIDIDVYADWTMATEELDTALELATGVAEE